MGGNYLCIVCQKVQETVICIYAKQCFRCYENFSIPELFRKAAKEWDTELRAIPSDRIPMWSEKT